VGNFKIRHDAKEAARASLPMARAQRRRDETRDEIQRQRDEMRDEPPVGQKARSFLCQWLCDITGAIDNNFCHWIGRSMLQRLRPAWA
jgi:hypothetical protein